MKPETSGLHDAAEREAMEQALYRADIENLQSLCKDVQRRAAYLKDEIDQRVTAIDRLLKERSEVCERIESTQRTIQRLVAIRQSPE